MSSSLTVCAALELVSESDGEDELVFGFGAFSVLVAATELQIDLIFQRIVQPEFQAAMAIGK